VGNKVPIRNAGYATRRDDGEIQYEELNSVRSHYVGVNKEQQFIFKKDIPQSDKKNKVRN
jgi:hypothetical protein